MMSLEQCYESLKGTRSRDGRLFITDFTDEDYENLLESVLHVLAAHVPIVDYFAWLNSRAYAWYKFKLKNSPRPEFHFPLLNKSPEDFTAQEQLAVIKFYLYRVKYCTRRNDD